MTLLRQMISKKFLLFFLIQFFLPLEAHNRSESYSKFQFLNLESGVEVKVTGTIKRGIFEALNPGIKFQSYLTTYVDPTQFLLYQYMDS